MDTFTDFMIGNAILLFRKKNGVDTIKLCKFMGISQPTLSRIENGKTSLTLTQFIDFCGFAGVSRTQFFKEIGKTKPKATVKL